MVPSHGHHEATLALNGSLTVRDESKREPFVHVFVKKGAVFGDGGTIFADGAKVELDEINIFSDSTVVPVLWDTYETKPAAPLPEGGPS